MDGQSCFPIHRVFSFDHVVLNVAPYAVLRPEQSGQVYIFRRTHTVRGMIQLVIHRSLIANQSDTRAAQQVQTRLAQFFDAQQSSTSSLQQLFPPVEITAPHFTQL